MKRAVLFAVGTLFAVSIFAQGIKDLDDAWVKAAKAGDVEGLVKLYDPTAVTYMPDEMKAKGTAQIRESFQGLIRMICPHIDINQGIQPLYPGHLPHPRHIHSRRLRIKMRDWGWR